MSQIKYIKINASAMKINFYFQNIETCVTIVKG